MQGVEISHCNASIGALLAAYYAFTNSTVSDILKKSFAYGKEDTLGMDAGPEIIICDKLREYDENSLVITEETGSIDKNHFGYADEPSRFRTVFLSDPMDRSRQMAEFFSHVSEKEKTVGEVIRTEGSREKWEKDFGVPASITGGSSSITCVRRGIPIFSVIINFITEQIFVFCSAGSYMMDIPPEIKVFTLDEIKRNGTRIYFNDGSRSSIENMKRFVTFMGKTLYRENLLESKLLNESEILPHVYYEFPGGPSRILYLSSLWTEDKPPIGFILSNGEKIGEWVHWLSCIRFARSKDDQNAPALLMFETYQDRPRVKDGVLMSTPPAHSIFRPVSEFDKRMFIDVRRFVDFPNPSKVRSTLIITHPNNYWVVQVAKQNGYRPIIFLGD